MRLLSLSPHRLLGRVSARRGLTTRPLPSIEAAAEETIAALKVHPGLLNEVLKRGDEDVRATARRALDRAFDEADVDGDGSVSREEFRNWTTRRYASAAAPADAAAAATGSASEAAPGGQQLRRLALKIGIPFIGFGFLDNAIMITAGDSIDATFGATLGLSALAAAGLGNLVSDVVGIQASTVIENVAAKRLPEPGLSPAQLGTSSARVAVAVASMIGISIGCVLGMCPLLFMEDDATKRLREVFAAIDVDGTGTIEVGELDRFVHKLGLDLDRVALEKVFVEIDADRSRSLSFDEFRVLAARFKGGPA